MVLKPGGRRLRFTAVEQFAVDHVAFWWRARFPLVGPISMRVTDGYDGRAGLLEVRLLGVPVQRRRGSDLAKGEAFRYLAEIAWMPHAILANDQLQWRQLDERVVEVATSVGGEPIVLQLIFNDDGDITQTVAERPRLEAGGAVTRWVGQFGDYASFNGIRMPAHGEVGWELREGPFTYWRGTITSAEAR